MKHLILIIALLSAVAPASYITTAGSGGGGGVSAVGLALPTTTFSISGSPITSSGTLTGAFKTQTANTVLAGPTTGVAATPAWRALVAADIPNLAASIITSGTLPIARGGTNSATSLSNNRVMVSSGSAIVEASAITASRALASDANGIPVAAATTATELGFVNGVTSAIQTQMDAKLPTSGIGLVEQLTGFMEAPTDKTYVLDQSASYAYTINRIIVTTVSGTTTLAVKIGGTSVTGISAVSVSSTPATGTATAANSVSVGDKVTLVLSSSSSPVDLSYTLKFTR